MIFMYLYHIPLKTYTFNSPSHYVCTSRFPLITNTLTLGESCSRIVTKTALGRTRRLRETTEGHDLSTDS